MKGLRVYNTPTEHTHENEQFRRVALKLSTFFEAFDYTGILIGNPYNEDYIRFRADALLIYDKGVVIIDFKNYYGELFFSQNIDGFKSEQWFIQPSPSKPQIPVKGGSYINPFFQLSKYRDLFKSVLSSRHEFCNRINSGLLCIANIFSGPITLRNKLPGSLPYYKIIQEDTIGEFLQDFYAENVYAEDIAQAFLELFPCEEYKLSYNAPSILDIVPHDAEVEELEVEDAFKEKVRTFLSDSNEKIMVLKSMDYERRDRWSKYIESVVFDFGFQQLEKWCHSTRIAKYLSMRGIEKCSSIYREIYGGDSGVDDTEKSGGDYEKNIVPLRGNSEVDSKLVIVVHEAHLITRSYNDSDLLRFGSGRLLVDLFEFLPDTFKLIFIGDPYSLAFGKEEDSALNTGTLQAIAHISSVFEYVDNRMEESLTSKDALRKHLSKSMDVRLFNTLSYSFGDETLSLVESDEIKQILHTWFNKPLITIPTNKILFYKNADCAQTNRWIKRECLKNGDDIAKGDLLIVYNNVYVPNRNNDERVGISNGCYLAIQSIGAKVLESVSIKQADKPIQLSFAYVGAELLDELGRSVPVTAYLFDNFFVSDSAELSKEEQIAYRVLIGKRLKEWKKKYPFEESDEYRSMLASSEYNSLNEDDRIILEKLVHQEEVENSGKEVEKLLRRYKRPYNVRMKKEFLRSDLFANALRAKYGWAITVHKAIGAQYDKVILKGKRKDGEGISNENYYRWLYSGITSGDYVKICQPQELHPLMNCEICRDGTFNISAKRSFLICGDEYIVPEQYKDLLDKVDNKNLRYAIAELSVLIEENMKWRLGQVEKKSEYLTKSRYFHSEENGAIVIAFDTKGVKDNYAVSGVRLEKAPGLDTSNVLSYIQLVMGGGPQSDTSGLETIEDFRKPVYEEWMKRFKEKGLRLFLKKSHEWKDIFVAETDSKAVLTINVHYRKDGFFSKIELSGTEDVLKILSDEDFGIRPAFCRG